MTDSEIYQCLCCYLEPDEAWSLAHMVHEDMDKIGFALRPIVWNRPGIRRQAEYAVASEYNLHSNNSDQALSGSFVTTGNFLRLAQCCNLGRRLLPDLWPHCFARRLADKEHLNTLNEIWWLKFWRGIASAQRGPKASPCATDFEWRLHIQDGLAEVFLNLEVKRRLSGLNQWFKGRRRRIGFDDIAKKFDAVPENEANIAAITIYATPSTSVLHDAKRWLNNQPHVHGLVVWQECHPGASPMMKWLKPGREWVGELLKSPAPEDTKVAGFMAGTVCRPEEMLGLLERTVRQLESRRIVRDTVPFLLSP